VLPDLAVTREADSSNLPDLENPEPDLRAENAALRAELARLKAMA
jgi:hypothetical protein